MSDLKQTPLYETYRKMGAKTIDFGGWALPVQFTGIKKEHHAVRESAGLFDVSHMGEVSVQGDEAEDYLQYLVTNNVKKLKSGGAQYTAMCYENGGTVDDLIIYKKADNDYLLVVNAANTEKDYEWIKKHSEDFKVEVENISEQMAQLAIQGPSAEKILQTLTDTDLSSIKFFKFADDVEISGVRGLVSRTGYTGEDGFEIYLPWDAAPALWDAILEAGKEEGLEPCGLGARDTLRFEANLPLYGQELTAEISPVEAGIGFAVKTDKEEDFIGKDVLKKQKENKPDRKIVGLEMIDKGIPRAHYSVWDGDKQIGEVTTGTQSPTLGKNLGLAILDKEYKTADTEVEVDIRGKKRRAKVVPTPFYKR